MPDLLLELGCEELPATFVERAYNDLTQLILAGLNEANLSYAQAEPPLGTPRRLIARISGIPARQPDQVKEQRGPGLASAFDESGNPTKALEGFCRGQGVAVADLEKRDGYVWIKKQIIGRDSIEVLSEVIPAAIRKLTFDKSMRWGASRMRFARPIRWILALYDEKVVPFDIEGVASGNQSRGHRFYHPEPFVVKDAEDLLNQLFSRKVDADAKEREKTIRETSIISASGIPEIDEKLLKENAQLTEWPQMVEGEFKSEYLNLPEPVLITAMAKHEKMFPVRNQSGTLTNRFIFTRNSGEDETVRAGTEWVLNARFNDAKFFYEEDKKTTLEGFLERTTGIIFQEKLGSVRQRADRLSAIAAKVNAWAGAAVESDLIESCRLCKADLSTGLVSELASLQGVIGGEYAKREGLSANISTAIAKHYDLTKIKNPSSNPAEMCALLTLVTDQVDKCCGYLGIGLTPSGSSDPFGLRRAATLLIESAWLLGNTSLNYESLLLAAGEEYRKQGIEVDANSAVKTLQEIFLNRYDAIFDTAKKDHIEAATSSDDRTLLLSPVMIKDRLALVESVSANHSLIQTLTRPINIVRSALEKGVQIPESYQSENLDSKEGLLLSEELQKWIEISPSDRVKFLEALDALQPKINQFFDSTMIMVDNEVIRSARLSLLQTVSRCLLTGCDFTKIVMEG